MRWSYDDYLNTPTPVIDECVAWLREQAEEERKQQAKLDAERNRPRRR